jgi:putative membrane protein
MQRFLLRVVVYAGALAVTAALLPGIHISNNEIQTLLIVAFIFGVLNAIVKPVVIVLSCPLIILTLGLFFLAINGILLLITDAIAGDRFQVDSLGWAILGGLVLGLVASLLENVLGLDADDKDDEVVIIKS